MGVEAALAVQVLKAILLQAARMAEVLAVQLMVVLEPLDIKVLSSLHTRQFSPHLSIGSAERETGMHRLRQIGARHREAVVGLLSLQAPMTLCLTSIQAQEL